MNNKVNGVGLLELLLALAIIAVLVLMSTRYFRQADTNAQVNIAMQNIQALYAGYQKCMADKLGVSKADCSINTMVSENYLPAMFEVSESQADDGSKTPGPSGANPWGGSLSVSSSGKCKTGSGPWTTIQITGVPFLSCTILVQRMAQTLTTGQCIINPDWEFGDDMPTCGKPSDETKAGSPTFNM